MLSIGLQCILKKYINFFFKFAESTFIAFPAREEPQIQLWVVYESHGGLAINRPFKVDDTVKVCGTEERGFKVIHITLLTCLAEDPHKDSSSLTGTQTVTVPFYDKCSALNCLFNKSYRYYPCLHCLIDLDLNF